MFQSGQQTRRLNTNFRRNGKLQSCEPCRKGKLRCDHMMPICGRCVRRRLACVYHPAPLTKGSLPTPRASEENSPSLARESIESESVTGSTLPFSLAETTSQIPYSRFTRASSLPTHSWSSLHYGQQTIEELRRPVPVAHLHSRIVQPSKAFIQHAAILAENELRVGISPSNNDIVSVKPSRSEIERGAAVLSLLKDLPNYLRYIEKWFSFPKGIVVIEPMVKIMTFGITATWGKWLNNPVPGAQTDLRFMSEKIWENTLKPLSPLLNQHTTAREFCNSVTGEGLRWEVVGLIITIVALLCASVSDGDPIFCSHNNAPVDRAALLLKTYNASQICAEFCDDWSILNDLSMWLMYGNLNVYCSMRTRGSYENWKKLGNLITAVIFFNLHEDIKVDEKTPFWMAEIRKRLFCWVYQNDKYNAIYHGRPPRLTRQYCKIQVPLDLSDAQLMLNEKDLKMVVNSLDEQGFNKRNTIQRCTIERLFMTDALITEEILEISMGLQPMTQEEILERAADIERRATERWERIPSFLKLDEERPFFNNRLTPVEILWLAFIRVDVHYHHYLLQRTLVKKVGASPERLLSIAKQMFGFVLHTIHHKELFRDFQNDYLAFLGQNGIPSAVVIAVELLNQEQNQNALSNSTNRLPRSQTIQDLSVFVAHLGIIALQRSGYSFERGLKFLKKILDTILDPVEMGLGNDVLDPEFGDLNYTDSIFQTGDENLMQFLVDWEQENWSIN